LDGCEDVNEPVPRSGALVALCPFDVVASPLPSSEPEPAAAEDAPLPRALAIFETDCEVILFIAADS
jgi:hypothetical protein